VATPPNKRTSLTGRLAIAAAERGVVWPEQVVDDPVDDDHAPGCTASVVSGQHCRRGALPGGDLCASHAAMGSATVITMRPAR
jgi:hypothetical protein